MTITKTDLLFIIISALLGLCGLFASPLAIMALGVIYFLLLLSGIGIVLCSYFLGRKALKAGFIAIVPIATYFLASTIFMAYQHKKAAEVITFIEAYCQVNRYYPKQLKLKTVSVLRHLTYQPSDDSQSFRIEYQRDGFTREYFDKAEGGWGTLGWND